jgi:mono/diheme cytochrome c family protein
MRVLILLILLALPLDLRGVQDGTASGVDLFETKIRPLLIERCASCHGEQSGKKKGGLTLDRPEGLLKGGSSGPAFVAGAPEKSRILQAVRYTDPDLQMPPEASKRLSKEQVADLEAWIRQGAPLPRPAAKTPTAEEKTWELRKKWVFEPPADPPVPSPKPGEHPIDAFLRAKREPHGLEESPSADRRTLLRRVTFDLIGLPPTPEELSAFESDPSSDAFSKVVDRLLASPHYGERWGRHWLDLARYAVVREDVAAKRKEPSEIPEAWRYRDWVVDAFNRDLPYDDFLVHQIAGDLLPPKEPGGVNIEGIVASGFLAIGEWGIQDDNPEKMIWDTADENIDAIGRTFLGLTLSCTRCHDHKFDPLTTRDYYALAGIFISTHVVAQPAKIGVQTPMIRIPLVQQAEIDRSNFQTAESTARIKEMEKKLAGADPTQHSGLKAELDRLKKNLPPPIPSALGAREGGIPGTSYAGFQNARIRIRGDFQRPGDEVPRGFPEVLVRGGAPKVSSGSGRWALAKWLSSPGHPLTARVMVNRIWQHHFGEGLVRTPSNFGRMGEAPTHPELLDWLAHRFVESGWSVKAMHRLMLHSAAYRRSSVPSAGAREKDPENRLLSRMNRRRLEAEAFRDALLAVSGTLDRTRGGPADPDPAGRRRMVYLQISRTSKSPFEALFDGSDANTHTDRRTVSTVAPQALFLLNNPFVLDAAAAFARRLIAETPAGGEARAARAYRLLYGRAPARDEIDLVLEFVGKGDERAWIELARTLLCSNEFVVVD